MSKSGTIILAVVLVAAVVGAGIFIWPMLAAQSGEGGGLAPAIIMIIGAFVLGGVLMALMFRSSRGHDADVHNSVREGSRDSEPGPDSDS